ncbi:MAG: hypothetical protein ABFR19_01455 [Pseudomonadota bacterium]
MSIIEYIGDEISAAGYRLGGVKVHIADRQNTSSLIGQACERASLVLVGAATAHYLSSAERDRLLARINPPVIIVADLWGNQTVPDIAKRIHQQLGMVE